MLAPFWALGLRGDAIVWAAWALSFAALGALAWEASALTRGLAGRAAAVGAGAMTVVFGGFVWCAASGMEVVPFAWAIARASRRASEWSEAGLESRSTRRAAELVALAWVVALFRPEGAVTALFVAATLAAFPRRRAWRERALALAAAGAVIATPLLLWALTGSARSNTAVVKLLPGNPYYSGDALVATVEGYAKLLVGTLLNGDEHAAEFLPHGGAPLAMAGPRGGGRARWARASAMARGGRAADGAHDVRAVLLLHVPLEPPALPLAVRHGVDHRPRLPRAARRRRGRGDPPAVARGHGPPLRRRSSASSPRSSTG